MKYSSGSFMFESLWNLVLKQMNKKTGSEM